MDDDEATQVIEAFDFDDVERTHRKDGAPIGFLKLLKQKNLEEAWFPLFEGANKIGRDIGCHVSVASKTISKEHCCVEVVNDCCLVYDLGSSNKSRRNKLVLIPNVRYDLNDNDVLTLADVDLVFIKSNAVHLGDPGSETESLTESESLIPAVELENSGIEREKSIAGSDDDDEGSDQSCDILQPTQHEGGHLIGSYNPIRAFVEDSFREGSANVSKSKDMPANGTVLETPPLVFQRAGLANEEFVPESESETEDDPKLLPRLTPLACESKDRGKFTSADEPTQAYLMDFTDESESNADTCTDQLSVCPKSAPARFSPENAPTQVFDAASTLLSDPENAPTQVFSQFAMEMVDVVDSNCQKSADPVNFKADIGETLVVDETTFPEFSDNQNAVDKTFSEYSRVTTAPANDQPTQLYVEETQAFEDSVAMETPKADGKVDVQTTAATVRDSGGSVDNFSPQSASTQEFHSDANASSLSTLVLETTDREDPSTPVLTCNPPSANVDLRTDDLCTQIFTVSPQIESKFHKHHTNTDELCTQVYNDAEVHDTVGNQKICSNSDDLCTQIYGSNNSSSENDISVNETVVIGLDDHISELTAEVMSKISEEVLESDGALSKSNPGNTDEFATQVFIVSPEKNIKNRNSRTRQIPHEEASSKALTGSGDGNETSTEAGNKKRTSKLSSKGNLAGRSRSGNKAKNFDVGKEIPGDAGNSSGAEETPMKSGSPEAVAIPRTSRRKAKDESGKSKTSGRGPLAKRADETRDSDREIQSSLEQAASASLTNRRTSVRQGKGKSSKFTDYSTSLSAEKKIKGNKGSTEILEPGQNAIETKSADLVASLSSSEDLDLQSSKEIKDSEVVDGSQTDDSLPSLSSLCALSKRSNCAERLKIEKLSTEFPVSRVADTEFSIKLYSNVPEKKSHNFTEVTGVESNADVNRTEAESVKVNDTELTRNRGRRLHSKGNRSSNTEAAEKSDEIGAISHCYALESEARTSGVLERTDKSETGQQNTATICDIVDGKNLASKGNAGRRSMSLKKNLRNSATISMGLDDEETGMKTKSAIEEKGSGKINSLCELQIVCDKFDSKVKKTGTKKSGKTIGDGFTEHKPISSDIGDCDENINSNLANIDLEINSTKSDIALVPDEQKSCPVDIVDKKILRNSRKAARNSEAMASENLKPELPLSSKKNVNEGKRSRKLVAKASSDNKTSELNKMNTDLSEDDGAQLEADKAIPDVSRKSCHVASGKMNSKAECESKGTTITEKKSEAVTDDASSNDSLADLNGSSRTKSGSGRTDRGNHVNQTKAVKEVAPSDSNMRLIFGQNAVEILDFGCINENRDASGDKAASRMSLKRKSLKTTDVETSGFASTVTEPTLDGDGKVGQRGRKSKVQSKEVDATVAKSDSSTPGRKRKITEEICNQEQPTLKESRDLKKCSIQIEDNISQIESVNSKAALVTESKRLRRVPKEPEGDKTKNKDSPIKPMLTEQHLDEPKAKKHKSLVPVELVTPKPKVMFTGVVDENGQKCVKVLGGEMVDSIYDCTHLVTDQVRRTVKFLCGVARGLPIVSPKWLEASQMIGKFLDPSDFLVIDAENEKKFNFCLRKTLQLAAKQPLLLGLGIHVTENVRPDPKQMKDIIQCAGGKFLAEAPKSFEENVIIVTCEDKDLLSCGKLEEMGFPLVSSEYIMTGILQQRLDAIAFQLKSKRISGASNRATKETVAGTKKKQRK